MEPGISRKEPMKKPLLATLGVAGACAACCAIPLALPIFAGLSAAGLTSFGLGFADLSIGVVVGTAVLAMAFVAGIGLWLRSRQQPKSCAVGPDLKASCGCASGASRCS